MRAPTVRIVLISVFVLLCTVAGWSLPKSALGQTISREYPLKAAFLYQFTTYVRWPETVFADEKSPFVFGILGTDQVGSILRKVAKVKDVGGRPIVVRNYSKPENIRDCHLLFISQSVEAKTQASTLRLLAGKNMLIVGETQDFLAMGGVFNFAIEQNRIKIRISKSAYERESLSVSSKLLRVATVVE